jgi:hypothetical protein
MTCILMHYKPDDQSHNKELLRGHMNCYRHPVIGFADSSIVTLINVYYVFIVDTFSACPMTTYLQVITCCSVGGMSFIIAARDAVVRGGLQILSLMTEPNCHTVS